MLISVVIPTYNNAKTIAKAINSALSQNYENDYEILIVNNASTDGTSEILAYYIDQKIRVLNNCKTVDLFSNHNICLKEAKGDYILFCHSDDELFPDALAVLSNVIERRGFPKKYIVWGHSMFRDYSQSLLRVGQPLNSVFSGESAIPCFMIGGLTPSGTCYSRESLLEIGGFPKMNSKIPPGDWYIMLWSAFNYFEFEMIDRLLFKREYGSTAVNGITWKQWLPHNKEAFDLLFDKLKENQKVILINAMKNHMGVTMYPSFKQFLSSKERIKYLLKYWIRHPQSIFLLFQVAFIKI